MTKMLKEALYGLLSEQEINEVYSAFDIIGDIIVIKIPESIIDKKHLIGETLIAKLKPIKSVLMQSSPIRGDFRLREVQHLAGENRTTTVYKEHNCKFKVDISKVYFSPRLSTERDRIANLVNDEEVIINMFAGIGTFSVVIAKKHRCKIYSIDINPDAYALCIENMRLNRVNDYVVPLLGDTRKIIEEDMKDKADRVLMPLPEQAKDYLDYAIMAVKNKGIIHYFTHLHADSKKEAMQFCAHELVNCMKIKYELLTSRVVRPVGPRYYQVVADLRVTKNGN